MTMTVNMQRITSATFTEHDAGKHHLPFSSVEVCDVHGSCVSLFLPNGTGADVANAINAAIARDQHNG